jgi:toxin ParE1/3/4
VAARFLSKIEGEFGIILQTPLIGVKREQFAPGLRVTFHSPYAIYYLPAEQELVIVRVLHGARDVEVIAAQGGFEQDGS